eukprot:TRINITY_DN62620_c0_g1_i1.p1 TRINITY_DN62620_c0_g1~~TRINITY_DN62620_c0_g1_i1.p1  ORF type:complete len:642 (-),score=142.05 TRINITY_DN62620_c0_g1_i1:122-1951(-)
MATAEDVGGLADTPIAQTWDIFNSPCAGVVWDSSFRGWLAQPLDVDAQPEVFSPAELGMEGAKLAAVRRRREMEAELRQQTAGTPKDAPVEQLGSSSLATTLVASLGDSSSSSLVAEQLVETEAVPAINEAAVNGGIANGGRHQSTMASINGDTNGADFATINRSGGDQCCDRRFPSATTTPINSADSVAFDDGSFPRSEASSNAGLAQEEAGGNATQGSNGHRSVPLPADSAAPHGHKKFISTKKQMPRSSSPPLLPQRLRANAQQSAVATTVTTDPKGLKPQARSPSSLLRAQVASDGRRVSPSTRQQRQAQLTPAPALAPASVQQGAISSASSGGRGGGSRPSRASNSQADQIAKLCQRVEELEAEARRDRSEKQQLRQMNENLMQRLDALSEQGQSGSRSVPLADVLAAPVAWAASQAIKAPSPPKSLTTSFRQVSENRHEVFAQMAQPSPPHHVRQSLPWQRQLVSEGCCASSQMVAPVQQQQQRQLQTTASATSLAGSRSSSLGPSTSKMPAASPAEPTSKSILSTAATPLAGLNFQPGQRVTQNGMHVVRDVRWGAAAVTGTVAHLRGVTLMPTVASAAAVRAASPPGARYIYMPLTTSPCQ